MLTATVLSMGGLTTWVVKTTQENSVSVPQLSVKIDRLSDQIQGVKDASERRDHEQELRNEQIDQLLNKHNLDISEALAEHNREIDGSIANMTALLDQHGKDLFDLKSFVQSLKDQKQVIVVRHAEAEEPPIRFTPSTPAPIRAVGNVLNELLGTAPHFRSGTGRRPGQPRRSNGR